MAFRLESQAEPIPGYRLIDRLGGGGFGEVWKAEAPGGLLKAIKFVYGDLQTSDQDRVRAEQELKSLSRVKTVRHPYILSLERFDIVNGQLLIVMELADRNLWDRFRECRTQGLPGIPRDELLGYMEESAEALDLMNTEYQLQHLDIKPQNLFLVYNHVKVADFGLVKDLEGRVASVTGGVTPLYAAPEMFDGWISRYCDQYSLAIVYQELLTGHRCFSGTNVHQLVMQHVNGKPNLDPLPADERDIIARALSKKPDERFASCGELVQALRNKTPVAPPASVSRPPTPLPDSLPEEAPPEKVQTPPPQRPPSASRVLPRSALAGIEAQCTTEHKKAPPEISEDGELFPSVVVGLGGMGLKVLKHLHRQLIENFGSREALPNIRLLYLDTDPEAPQAAGAALPTREVLLARLGRASHYLKHKEGRPRIESWFYTNMLYRIQRHQITGGVRALGRLAFVDNYRPIAARLRSDLEACLEPEALQAARRHTGLRVRTNRPRVYVAAGLAGGTGGGIFLDVAYVVREHLRRLGYANPDVVGLLMVPAAGDHPGRRMALGNAFAALTELNYFSSIDNVFSSRYDEREGTIRDQGAPFTRSILMPLPEGNEPPNGAPAALLGEFLFRELTTPLGLAADSFREVATSTVPPKQRMLLCQSFGLFRYTWPRRILLQRAGRRLCRKLAERWSSKDGPSAPDTVEKWAAEQWEANGLGSDALMARLHGAGEKAVGKPPETLFAELMNPLTPRGWWNKQVNPDTAVHAVTKIDELLGEPSGSAVLGQPGTLEGALREETDAITADVKRRLTQLTVPLMEQPSFRIGGAERAGRRLSELVRQGLRAHEVLTQELTAKAAQAYERLQVLRPTVREIAGGGRRTSTLMTELVDVLRTYAKTRYQSMVLRALGSVYATALETLSDRLRELSTCRSRLYELADILDARDADPEAARNEEDRLLYPAGCRNLEDAVEQLVTRFDHEDVDRLDGRVQDMIRQQFRGLGHVCLTAHLTEKLAGAMVEEAVAFAGTQTEGEDVVAMFLNRHGSEEETRIALGAAFAEAAPRIGGTEESASTENSILAVPSSPREARLRELARQAVPEAELVPAASVDEIVFYREETQLLLTELEQLGTVGREAYQQMIASENFTPHSRNDVAEWQPASAGAF